MKDYSSRATEASERLRAHPAILHYKCPHNYALRPKPERGTSRFGVPVRNCLKKEEVVAPCLDIPESPNIQSVRNRARIHKRNAALGAARGPRQLKPILRGTRPQQEPAKRNTAFPMCCHSGRALPRDP